MTAKLTFCMSFASVLFGQIDSYHLRAKYGPPLDRETFSISTGVQLVVDYGPDQQVRRLELPPAAQSDDILLELVPMSIRGKQLGSGINFMSRASQRSTEYEHVIISEPQDPNAPGQRTGVNVVFKSSVTSQLGQLDSYHLRAKYGPPLDRETFTISPGFQMIVDYGPDEQACRLDLPLNQPGVSSRKQADDVLLDLLPTSVRGKHLNSAVFVSGINSINHTVYEHVVISEPGNANDVVQPNRITLSFKREECRGL